MSEKGIKYICDLCGQLIEIGRPRFILQGKLYCAYDGAEFDETPTIRAGTIREEMERILRLMESKSEKELEDEVYYSYQLDLCSTCRKKLYLILERKNRLE